jgi:uncharacterized protein
LSDATASNVRVPLSDGKSLAGRIVLPEGDGPFPALVTFYPYRKDDFIGAGSAQAAAYHGGAGYASVLIDNRGYGGSTGRAYQAWDPREFDDGVEALDWVTQQPWSDGTIGLVGSSYGGHMAFGVAALSPPGLKAIASVYGAADIYHDFVYPGGCPNALGASAWSALMVALELAPPTLQDPGGAWLEAWRDRLDRLDDGDISTLVWPAHPDYDDYWRRRAIPVEEISVPAFFLSGWRDLLCQGMLHAYESCRTPKRLLVGPWSHAAPDLVPDAPYDWLLELRLWWDEWLKGEEPEVPRPDVVYWVQGEAAWHSATEWPPESATAEEHYPSDDGLAEEASDHAAEYRCVAAVGGDAGLWYPMAMQIGAFEQARDDARSLAYTSPPLAEDKTIAGTATARVRLSVPDGESVHLTVKLCEVGPDGASTLISSGWRRIDAGPAREVACEVELYPTAYRVRAGNRLRWTIAGGDFPRIWPSPTEPDIVVLSSEDAPTAFRLPVVPAGEHSTFEPPLPEAPQPAASIVRAEPICRFGRDEATQSFSVTVGLGVTIALVQGGTFALENSLTASIREGKPLSATVETSASVVAELATGEVVRAEATGLSSRGRRHISGSLTSGEHTLYERRWSSLTPG